MKKRMFLTTVLMTLVLLVAVTTATFAWYTASSGNAELGQHTVTVDTADDTISIGNVKLNIALSNVSTDVGPSDKALGSEGKVIFVVGNAQRVVEAPYELEGTATWKITAEMAKTVVDGNVTEWEEADAAALASIAGDYTITFTAENARIAAATGAVALEDSVQSYTVSINVSTAGVISVTSGTLYFAINSIVTNQAGSPVVTLKAKLS